MKKSIIVAGAASAVLAAMPVFGVFAETTVKDELTVNVQSSCQLADITPSGTSGSNANNYYGTGNPGDLVVLSAGTASTSGTATSVRIECNNASGYKITPTFTSLTGPSGSTAITYSASPAASAGSGTWTAYSDGSTASAAIPTTGITGPATASQTYTFSYKVGLASNQMSGDYTGSATYTLGPDNS
jgi:hypothetical protein